MSTGNGNTTDLSAFSKQYAARDLPGERTLKYREPGQAAPDDIRKDSKSLRRDLEERERISANSSNSNNNNTSSKRLSIDSHSSSSSKKHRSLQDVAAVAAAAPFNPDADEVLPDNDDSEDDDSDDDSADSDSDEMDQKSKKKSLHQNDEEDDEDDDDDDDDDDDTEALMAELNKIKQERALEAAKQEAERKVREEKIRVENILKGNPLLNPDAAAAAPFSSKAATNASDFRVKRRWDDDVVFKNCAKVEDGQKKDFINDTIRSEFHRKFMDRYVK
jgi:protein CWC15